MSTFSCHLSFDGTCGEAMKFYEKTLSAKEIFRMTYGESPMSAMVAADSQGKIMHASIEVGDTRIMGADAPDGRYQKPQGIVVSFATPDLDEAKKAFDALADGGSIQMAFEETFWAKGFGMCTDKFDIPWMVNCEKPMRV